MSPVDLPPLEPTAIRPSGGQWQPPPTDVRVAPPPAAADAWSITGAGWPARPEEVMSLFFSWPETRTLPAPEPIADLRQLFISQGLDISDPDALMAKLETMLRRSIPDSVSTDWTAGLMRALGSQLAQQTPARGGTSSDGVTQLLRYALTVLGRESNPPPPAPRILIPTAPPEPLVRSAQTAGEQSYLIFERDTVSGLLTRIPSAESAQGQALPRAMPETPAQAALPPTPGGNTSAAAGSTPAAATPETAQAPAGTTSQAAAANTPQGTPGATPGAVQAPANPAPELPGFPATPQPLQGQAAAQSPSTPPPTPASTPAQPATMAAAAPTIPGEAAPSPPASVPPSAVPAAPAPALPNSQGQAATPPLPELPMVSLAEIVARASSMAPQSTTPQVRPEWMSLLTTQGTLPTAAEATPREAPVTPNGAMAQGEKAVPQMPATVGHEANVVASRAQVGMPGVRGEVNAQQPLQEARIAGVVGAEGRVEAGAPPAHAARTEQAAQSAVPQQRVGMLPLVIGNEPVPAWLQMEWIPVTDRDGRGGKAQNSQSLMVSVHVAGETLGRVAFHLAWLPKELAGTIVIEKPEVLQAAQLELPDLERRLAEAGLPRPRLRLLKQASAPWDQGTQELERP